MSVLLGAIKHKKENELKQRMASQIFYFINVNRGKLPPMDKMYGDGSMFEYNYKLYKKVYNAIEKFHNS
jgi:hypothetical protein